MRTFLALLLISVSVCAQTSGGSSALDSKIVTSTVNSECSMTDLGQSFINERSSTCSQNQSHFFNGEVRLVDSGEGLYASSTPYTGYELTSCACAQNATWTRTMQIVNGGETSLIRWTWKMYARNADCSLTLKRDLIALGCSYQQQRDNPEGWLCGIEQTFEGGTSADCMPTTPIVIDLDGDGLRLTDRVGGVEFDLDGDGQRGQLPWLKEDGWLVLNDYEDGIIRDGQQLFGDRSAQENRAGESPNGYAALRVFDDNKDERIDARDGVWRLLGIWRDFNHNGISEHGEVVSLTEIGIESLDLDYRESRRRDPHGNELRYRARVEWTNGAHTSSWDVFLTAQ